MTNPDLVTRQQAAKILNVHPATIDRWRESGKLPWFQVGERAPRFRRADVLALIQPVLQPKEDTEAGE